MSGTGECKALTAFFKGIQEPKLSDGLCTERVSNLMPEGWIALKRPNIGSRDGYVSREWASSFIESVRTLYPVEEWVVLLFSARGSHLLSSAIEEMERARIAKIALPSHTRD